MGDSSLRQCAKSTRNGIRRHAQGGGLSGSVPSLRNRGSPTPTEPSCLTASRTHLLPLRGSSASTVGAFAYTSMPRCTWAAGVSPRSCPFRESATKYLSIAFHALARSAPRFNRNSIRYISIAQDSIECVSNAEWSRELGAHQLATMRSKSGRLALSVLPRSQGPVGFPDVSSLRRSPVATTEGRARGFRPRTLAEGKGFEPSIQAKNPYNRLAICPVQPLQHPSA